MTSHPTFVAGADITTNQKIIGITEGGKGGTNMEKKTKLCNKHQLQRE
jgi:hypothetical protein